MAGVLQPTALVHETYLRLSRQTSQTWKNRSHFFGVAAVLMRYILIDQARRNRRSELATKILLMSESRSQPFVLEDLHRALNRLEQQDPRQCRVVELRYFGGLSLAEIAEAIGVSERTVRRDWEMARAWLHSELARR